MSIPQTKDTGTTRTMRPAGASANGASRTREVAAALVELYRAGDYIEAIDRLYAEEVVSSEADPPLGDQAATGKGVVRERHTAWLGRREIHDVTVRGPYLDGSNRFAMYLRIDFTDKATRRRAQVDEIAVYEVCGDKVVRETFLYGPDWV